MLTVISLSCLQLATPSLASPGTAASSSSLGVQSWSQTDALGTTICVQANADPFSSVFVWNKPEASDSPGSQGLTAVRILARGQADANGLADLEFSAGDLGSLPAEFTARLKVARRVASEPIVSTTTLPLNGSGGILGQTFDPNFLLADGDASPGLLISDQYRGVGMTISGAGNASPDGVLIFDSANPTGNDADLVTPGFGINNTVGLGNVLILPENVVDGDGDGIIDVPCDARFGGTMRFEFDAPYRMCSATILDIDDTDTSELRFFIGDAMTLETIPLQTLGDNSIQTLTFDKRDVRRFEVGFSGSGAVARLEMVPCSLSLDFDQTAFGTPRNLQAGERLNSQFADLGVSLSANNNVPGNPDEWILFDTANPTGDDTDLATPGFGLNNDTPLYLVGIIAENDVDADGDGLIDSPDDEEMGGQMTLMFDEDMEFLAAKVLDIDGVEQDVFTFFDAAGGIVDVISILALGDNSVQTLTPTTPITGVRSVEINIVGSGAVDSLKWCPVSNSL